MMNGINLSFTSTADKVMCDIKKASKAKFRRASTVAKKKLRDAAPVDTGDLRSSIKAMPVTHAALVGFSRPKGSHAWLVEHGHDLFSHGEKVGRVEGKPFFEKTWDAMIPELQQIISEPIEL